MPPSAVIPKTYNSTVSGVPSHWIPFYGSTLGVFYDTLTDMFVGDGPPRRSIHRPWNGSLPSTIYNSSESEYVSHLPSTMYDYRHLQPGAFANRHEKTYLSQGQTRFYCFCRKCWLAYYHRCPMSSHELQFGELRPPVVRPRTMLPGSWIYRGNVVKDKDYIQDMDMVVNLIYHIM